MIDVRDIKTGNDVAQLMRETRQSWDSGALVSSDGRCALGMIAHAAGIRDEVLDTVSSTPPGLKVIYSNNDAVGSKADAAARIEQQVGAKDISGPLHRWLTRLCKLQRKLDKS